MPQEEKTKTRAELLNTLFDLMTKSKNITGLPKERIETIKNKYRTATDANIKNGITMLEEDIKKTDTMAAKNKESLMKNIEKKKQLKAMETAEKSESDELAEKMLQKL
jgi:hypothetical protein